MMPILIKIKKGGKSHLEENTVGTEKFIYVLDGKISVTLGKENFKIAKGDSIYFDASFAHVFSNTGKTEARILSIMTPPAF